MKDEVTRHDHEGDEKSSLVPDPSSSFSRRSFLKVAGFSVAGAAVGCGRGPVSYAIPYLNQPEEMTPGRSAWYATMCSGCEARCGALVKLRDGRPIKVEGNPEHPVSRGGLCAIGQAQVLGLYDGQRLRDPIRGGVRATWPEVDAAIGEKLAKGRSIRVLTGSMIGPTEGSVIDGFLARFGDGKHVAYDPLSISAILDAHLETHGARVLPHYRFDRADVILGVECDFLGTWISPVEFASAYAARRVPSNNSGAGMSRHVQLESRMSLTGSNADERRRIAPHEIVPILRRIASRIGVDGPAEVEFESVPATFIDALANELAASERRCLVVCGANDPAAQYLVNVINAHLGNYGATLDIDAPSRQKLGSDSAFAALLAEMENGRVDALLMRGVNPVYDHPLGGRFASAMRKVALTVSFAERADETASLAHFICPDHHPFEAWNDAETTAGLATVAQPSITPLGRTRAFVESLAAWSGREATAYDIMREAWRERIYPRRKNLLQTFDAFWNKAVHDGFAELTVPASTARAFRPTSLATHASPIPRPAGGRFALVLHPTLAMLDGRHAHNPWLQELPDPVSKATWDNHASLSPAAASKLGVANGDVVKISLERDGATIAEEFPVFVQPGQHDDVVAIALGYGHEGTDRFALVGPQWFEGKPTVEKGRLVGRKASQFLNVPNGAVMAEGMIVAIEKTGRTNPLATTQRHHTLDIKSEIGLSGGEKIPVVRELTLAAALAGRGDDADGAGEVEGAAAAASLWDDDHAAKGHRWGMAIDLSRCTGCSACLLGCQSENNVPIVGKDEVMRSREMHWIRIDRYYAGDGDVETVHQPMTCQQCGHAPCETVCPVLATVHSSEGLNQQVYNRCVGTRYCANNCPIKARRFNWFDYPREDQLLNMALNPDVTVRSRGVMEKCSFCVQRIAGAKAEAKRNGVALKDGDIQPACAQSCPAKAIVFGDMNDPASTVAKAKDDPRHYTILPELNLDQTVGYLAKVRNKGADHV